MSVGTFRCTMLAYSAFTCVERPLGKECIHPASQLIQVLGKEHSSRPSAGGVVLAISTRLRGDAVANENGRDLPYEVQVQVRTQGSRCMVCAWCSVPRRVRSISRNDRAPGQRFNQVRTEYFLTPRLPKWGPPPLGPIQDPSFPGFIKAWTFLQSTHRTASSSLSVNMENGSIREDYV